MCLWVAVQVVCVCVRGFVSRYYRRFLCVCLSLVFTHVGWCIECLLVLKLVHLYAWSYKPRVGCQPLFGLLN